MNKPVLVIMAAGMGSRYGGLKQMDSMDEQGHIIMDFSIYDAKRAGFEKVVFIIKKEMDSEFREVIGNRIQEYMEVAYVYQELSNLPKEFSIPEGRVKPWGTGHAILSCIDAIDGPFAVINADDYYGQHAFQEIYEYLREENDKEKYHYAMVGYSLENTLTDHGSVARGVCIIDKNQELVRIQERTRIEKKNENAVYTEDDGQTWIEIPKDSIVSMNMWGFGVSILKELKQRFSLFLEKELKQNPLKCEYFLPFVVDELIKEQKATVTVLKSSDKWYGVTYKEDKAVVVEAISHFKKEGLYPEKLWNKTN